jgi:hypothetical protein
MKAEHSFFNLLGHSFDELSKTESISEYFQGQFFEQVADRYYLTNRKKGIGFVFGQLKNLIAIQLHKKENDYSSYTGDTPFRITFDDDADSVEKKIGLKEFQSGGSEVLSILGKVDFWRKYIFGNSYLHVKFDSEGIVNLMTIGLIID